MAEGIVRTNLSTLGHFADNNSVRIHYLDSGAGTSPSPGQANVGRDPIVFVPGLSDAADDYLPVLSAFGRRTIVIDLRGRGRSDTPEHGYDREAHMTDIAAVLSAAAVNQFHLVTFSRGTAYALPLALAQPERVRSVTIGDYLAGEIGFPGQDWPETFVAGRWRGQSVAERISLHAVRAIAKESVERRYWSELSGLGPNLMVVRAGRPRANSHVFIDDQAQAHYRHAVPSVEIVTFENSGHDLFREDPFRFPRVVAEFVERSEKDPSR